MDAAMREERRKSIGASDISGILGLSKWKTPLSVYFDKVEGTEETTSVAAELGHILEPWLLSKLVTRLDTEGKQAVIVEVEPQFVHPDYDFITCTPDALMTVDGIEGGVECKTSGEYRSAEWPDNGLPDEYYAQVQHQMACTGWPWVYVPFLIGNRKFDIRFVPRNEGFIRVLVERAVDFWNTFITPKVPPAPSGADVDTDILRAMYGGGDEEVMQLDMQADYDRYKELTAESKRIKEETEKVKQSFMAAMGNTELALVGERKIRWRMVERKGYTVEPSASRQFNIY